MPLEHTGKSRDGSKKTSSLTRSGIKTPTGNLQRSKLRRTKNVGRSYVNCVGIVTATSLCVLKEADNLPNKVAI